MTEAICFPSIGAIFPSFSLSCLCKHSSLPPPLFEGLNVVQRSASGEQSAEDPPAAACSVVPAASSLLSAGCILFSGSSGANLPHLRLFAPPRVEPSLISRVFVLLGGSARGGLCSAGSLPHRRWKLVLCRNEIWNRRPGASQQTGTDLFRTFAMLFLLPHSLPLLLHLMAVQPSRRPRCRLRDFVFLCHVSGVGGRVSP